MYKIIDMEEWEMRDVTPQSNWTLIIKSIGLAIGTVAVIALLKVALDAFLSVTGFILPLAVIYFFIFIFWKY